MKSRYIKVKDAGKTNYIVKVKLKGTLISINKLADIYYKAYKKKEQW